MSIEDPTEIYEVRSASAAGHEEDERLVAVRRYQRLVQIADGDSPGDEQLSKLANAAARAVRAPIGLVTLVDDDRSLVVGRMGTNLTAHPRRLSFCTHAIALAEPLVVENCETDERLASHPLVRRTPGVRSYAGVQLASPDGHVVGVLSVMSLQPRRFDTPGVEALKAIAGAVMETLNVRQAAAQLERGANQQRRTANSYQRLFQSHPQPMLVFDDETLRIIAANEAATAFYGYSSEEMLGLTVRDLHAPSDVPGLMRRLAELDGGLVSSGPWLHRRKNGDTVHVLAESNATLFEGRNARLARVSDVTDAVRVRQQLDESRALTESALSAIDDLFYVTDLEGRLLQWNAKAREVGGFTDEELSSAHAWDFFPDDELERAHEVFDTTLRDGQARMVTRLKTRDGRLIPFELTCAVMRSPDGDPIGVCGVARDIREREEASQRTQESRERLWSLIDATNATVWFLPADGVPTAEQPKWSEFTGQSAEEMVGSGWLDAVHPDDRDYVMEAWQEAVSTSSPYHCEHRLRRSDGEYRYMIARAVPRFDENGQVTEWVGAHTDIHDQFLSQRELRLNEERFRLGAMATHDVLWDWDVEGGHLDWGPHVAERFGWTEALAGTTIEWWAARVHPEDRDRVERSFTEAFDGVGSRWEEAYRFQRADGTFADVLDRGFVVRDTDGKAVRMVGSLQDLSDRIQTLDRLRESEQRATRILETINDGFFALDGEWRITYLNPQSEELLQQPVDELIGRNIWEAFPEAVGMEFEVQYRRAVENQEPVEFCEYFPPLERWFEVKAYPHDGGLAVHFADITGRYTADEALRRSEAESRKLAAVLSHATNGAVITDASGRIEWVNEGFSRMTGHSLTDVMGREAADVVYGPETDQDTIARMDELARNGQPSDEELLIYTRDGSQRWVHTQVQPIRDELGIVSGFIAISTDITQRKQAEQRLAEREAQFRQITEAMPQIVWTTTPNGYHDYFNSRWYEFTGMPLPEQDAGKHQGWNWKEYLHPDDFERSVARWQHSLITGESYEIEYRFRRASDGSYRWFIGRAEPLRDDQGRIVKWFGTCTDIHDLRVAETALHQSAERLRLATEAARLGVFDMQRPAHSYWSDSALELFGLDSADMLLPGTFLERVHPDDREKVEPVLRQTLMAHEPVPFDIEFRVVLEDERVRWLAARGEVSGVLAGNEAEEADEAGPGNAGGSKRYPRVTGVIVDVSDQKRHEAALIAAREAAEEAQRVADEGRRAAEAADRLKTAVLTNISHEIRTPLTALIGFADVLGSEVEGEHASMARYISKGGHRLLETLNSVLDFAQLEAGMHVVQLEEVALGDAAAETVELLRQRAEDKGLTLTCDIPEEHRVVVRADRGALHRIVMNLVSNAIKYTREGSVNVSAFKHEDYGVLEVKDTGVGIDSEFLPHLFREFRQESEGLERAFEGNGLGLAISKRLIELLDGTITVKSEKGVGSTFTVRLPLHSHASD